jgi:hypothetical protein
MYDKLFVYFIDDYQLVVLVKVCGGKCDQSFTNWVALVQPPAHKYSLPGGEAISPMIGSA